MEDRGGEHGIGSGVDGRGEVLELAGASGGDERDVDGCAGGADEFKVEALMCAVGVDAVEQDLPCPAFGCLADPFDGVDAGSAAAAMGSDLESRGGGRLCLSPPGGAR